MASRRRSSYTHPTTWPRSTGPSASGTAGYRPAHLFAVVVAENALQLARGLGLGAIAAGIAVGPAAMARGARLPVSAGGLLLIAGVLAAGLLSSFVATRVALRAPLVGALRSE